MTLRLLVQGLLNGVALGWIYILMGLGLSLIFGITRILQFAQGEFYMVGGYIVWLLFYEAGLPQYVCILLSMCILGIVGLVMNRGLFYRFSNQFLPPVVISVGLTLILQSSAIVIFGLNEKQLPRLSKGHVDILGSVIPRDRVVVVVLSVAIVAVLYVLMKRSRYGQAMVASVQSPEGALLQGISHRRMSDISMIVGTALAAAAGGLAGSVFALNPFMGTLPLVKGLTIIVIGGMGSIPGVIVGGLLLGVLDGVAPVFLPPGVASLIPLLFVIAILIFRPEGLLGHEE